MGCLADQIWSDHLELVARYAPKGLDTVSGDWFSPENIDHVHSSLAEWDGFFSECIVAIDEAMEKDDEAAQDMLSEFLDFGLAGNMRDWLEDEFRPFLIFPQSEAEDDVFSDKQCTALVQALMKYASEHPPVEVDEFGDRDAAVAAEEGSEPPAALADPLPAAVADPPPAASPVAVADPLPSLTAAIRHRRQTLSLRPRDRSTRGKTRKLLNRP